MNLEKYIISDKQLIEQAIEVIEFNHSRCVIVVNEHKKVVGVLSEGDLLRSILKGVNILSPLKNVMFRGFKYVKDRDDVRIKDWIKEGITLIPVLNDNNELIDIIVFNEYVSDKW